MASTYSSNLKIELQAVGENPGTWGTITNTNLGTALEQAIVGYGNPSYASDANLTLTYTDTNAAQAARALVLNVTSAVSLTATRQLVVPTIQKQYIVQNNTTGSQSITVKTSAGTGITVPNGRKAHLYVDGTNVIHMDDFVDINGGAIDGTTIGASSASTGAFTTLTATTLGGALNANSQAITNVNIDSGAIDGVTLGTSSAVTEAQIDNINLNGNTISSTNSNGNLVWTPNGTGTVNVSSNMLVGTTTGFTSTGAAGGMAVAGYGLYPVVNQSGGTFSITNFGLVVQNPTSLAADGSATKLLYGTVSSPIISNTGSAGSSPSTAIGAYASPVILSSGTNPLLGLFGGLFHAQRGNAADTSSNASNFTAGIQAIAATLGTVGAGASSRLVAASLGAYSGSGTSSVLDGATAFVSAGAVANDQSVTVTNLSGYRITGLAFGKTSGAETATVTNAYGFSVGAVDVYANGTVTNYYAFFAAAPTVTGTLTNRWGVYIADASSPNYFAGSVRVGAGTAAAPTLTTIADTNTGVFFPASDVVGVSTGGVERMRLDSSGNLGLGTSSPSTRLHVSNGLTDEVARFEGNGTPNPFISLYGSTLRQFYIQSTASDVRLWGQQNKPLVFATNNSERMRLDANGVLSLGHTQAFTWGSGIAGAKAIQLGDGYPAGSIASDAPYGVFNVLHNIRWDGTNWVYTSAAAGSRYATDRADGSHFFQTAPVGTGGTTATLTERLRIKGTGQIRFVPLSADPTGAQSGDVYYNSTTNKLKVYNGTAWVDLH